jgi:hypothetical protein
MCRFHTNYPKWGPYSTKPIQTFTSMEKDLIDDDKEMWDSVWWDDEINLSEWIETGEATPETFRCDVETVKTYNMLSSMIGRVQCEDCQPLVFRFEEDLSEEGYSSEMCHCGTFEHFSSPWRCIPCVLAEEARLVTMQQKYKVTLERNQRGEQYLSRVSYPKSTHRAILIISPDLLVRLWKTGGRAQLRDMRAVWENHWLVQGSQRENNGTHSCTAWNYARWSRR